MFQQRGPGVGQDWRQEEGQNGGGLPGLVQPEDRVQLLVLPAPQKGEEEAVQAFQGQHQAG